MQAYYKDKPIIRQTIILELEPDEADILVSVLGKAKGANQFITLTYNELRMLDCKTGSPLVSATDLWVNQ